MSRRTSSPFLFKLQTRRWGLWYYILKTSPPRLHFPQLNWEDSTTCQTWVHFGRCGYGPPVYRKKKTCLFQYEDVDADHSVVQEDTPPMKVFIGQHIQDNGKDGSSQSTPISYGAMTQNIPSEEIVTHIFMSAWTCQCNGLPHMQGKGEYWDGQRRRPNTEGETFLIWNVQGASILNICALYLCHHYMF